MLISDQQSPLLSLLLPLAPATLTVDELLFLGSDNAAQMCLLLPTPSLGIHPGLTVRKMAVTVALELGPPLLTLFLVCNTGQGLEEGARPVGCVVIACLVAWTSRFSPP